MIIVLSPAKRLDFEHQEITDESTIPEFLDDSAQLIEKLKKLKVNELMQLMNINEKLAEINYERYQNWDPDFSPGGTKPAILAFRGDVFVGMDPQSYSKEDLTFAQDIVRILSGLHGVLKPLDLIRPYRLEMGTGLKVGRSKNLYEFWNDKLIRSIMNAGAFKEDRTIINLASKEYFNALSTDQSKIRIIEPSFKEYKNGIYRPVHIFLKRARGMMTSYIVKNRITDPEQMKLFDQDGYEYNDNLSSSNQWVFTRG